MKIKPGSKKQKKIFLKQALKAGNKKKAVRIHFTLWKRKNGIPSKLKVYETRYQPIFEEYDC